MYLCMVYHVFIKDCGLKLNTPWNVREGVNTPTFGVNECQITVKKMCRGTDSNPNPNLESQILYTGL